MYVCMYVYINGGFRVGNRDSYNPACLYLRSNRRRRRRVSRKHEVKATPRLDKLREKKERKKGQKRHASIDR